MTITTRRLAAIMVADVVGYSRLMEQDEAGTLAALKQRRTGILAPLVSKQHGRVVKVMGDGVLVEFGSAVNAVACIAARLQQLAEPGGRLRKFNQRRQTRITRMTTLRRQLFRRRPGLAMNAVEALALQFLEVRFRKLGLP